MAIKLIGGPEGYSGVDVTQHVGNPREPGKKFAYFRSTLAGSIAAYEYSPGDGNYHFRPILSLQAEGNTTLKAHDIA